MPRKSVRNSVDVDEIDRQIAALQSERAKALQRKERELVQSLKTALAKVEPERRTRVVEDVRKVCDEVLGKDMMSGE